MSHPYGHLSDEESDDDETETFGGHGVRQIDKEEKEAYAWDIFENNPPEDETLAYEDQQFYINTIKTFKILTYICVFLLVLGAGVMSKITILLMTSQIRPDVSRQLCHEIPRRKREVQISYHERVQWTWAILFCLFVPELGCFIRSARIWLFKSPAKPTWVEFVVPMTFEILHVIGLGLLTFVVLPSVHVIQGTMMSNAVCLIPGICLMLSRSSKAANSPSQRSTILRIIVDFFAIAFQLFGIIYWGYLFSVEDNYSNDKPWVFPLAALLTSLGWWENFVSKNASIGFIQKLGEMRKRFELTRHFSYMFISLIKMLFLFTTMIFSIWLIGDDDPYYYFNYFSASFETTNLTVTEVGQPISEGVTVASSVPDLGAIPIHQKMIKIENSEEFVLWTMGVQFACAYICYITAKFACKIRIQGFSFALPLTLSVPVTLAMLVSFCGMRDDNVCVAKGILPNYIYWDCPTGSFKDDFLTSQFGWIWILFFFSQVWIVLHVWYPAVTRLASTEVLFCFPMYNAVLTDSDLVMNRKNDFDRKHGNHKHTDGNTMEDPEDPYYSGSFEKIPPRSSGKNSFADSYTEEEIDSIPKIIVCATMWHEEEEEMICMFKSVFRIDADQNARRVARTVFGVNDPSYYEYETNIFFDDAFKPKSKDDPSPIINDYVRKMLPAIDKAASLVHEVNITIGKPKRVPTPYGGRLEWVLPGKTKLIIHLKNKDKIRHRKRWSQCMYMYYLLGYKITANPEYSVERQETIARNTFLLALDGDIDFQPNAVELVVDLMKKNPNLAAACGRIHPTGSGPMVWYQKFEYAIGHWLQKATEHMIGCVLCSPGCFSLFRAKGLMDVNVMAKYTTPPSEPRHYVQYDQGEDRWLCTLLLQQGWRVEYCAASDSRTHAPEGFNEFFNQRRRWVPSTMANILDLLMDYKRTIKVNPNISLPYIVYQGVLMGGSILGPGTIFLMLVGAFVAAFKIDNYTSMYINISPILAFIITCYFFKSKVQLKLALLLSVLYALVMVAVLIALILQVVDDGLLAPSSIFLVAITISFIVAACVHPLEFDCLLHGMVYYITIPSMYLLLIIYSLFNLNDVTWGTRENPAVVAEQKAAEAAAAAAGKSATAAGGGEKKKNFLQGIIPERWQRLGDEDEEGSLEFNCAGLFKLACCTQPKPKDDLHEIVVKLNDKLETIQKQLTTVHDTTTTLSLTQSMTMTNGGLSPSTNSGPKANGVNFMPGIPNNEPESKAGTRVRMEILDSTKVVKRDDLMNPVWMEDRDLRKGEVDFLTQAEIDFWHKMIGKYLLPLYEDKKKKEEIASGLLDLRNKVVAAFFMINAVFVTAMFLLQLNKDKIFINWPLGGTHNLTWVEQESTFIVQSEYLKLEPLGLLFVGFYAVIMVVQFVGMLLHRWGTYSHIMASTMISMFEGEPGDHDGKMESKSIKFIHQLQKIKPANESINGDDKDGPSIGIGRRKTIIDLHKSKQRGRTKIQTLDRAFEKRMSQWANAPEQFRRQTKVGLRGFGGQDLTTTMNALQNRRETFIERRNTIFQDGRNRRQSRVQPAPSYNNHNDSPPPPPYPANTPRFYNGRRPQTIFSDSVLE